MWLLWYFSKSLNFLRFWEMRFIHKCVVFMILFILFALNP